MTTKGVLFMMNAMANSDRKMLRFMTTNDAAGKMRLNFYKSCRPHFVSLENSCFACDKWPVSSTSRTSRNEPRAAIFMTEKLAQQQQLISEKLLSLNLLNAFRSAR